jgi:hypothetical protein
MTGEEPRQASASNLNWSSPTAGSEGARRHHAQAAARLRRSPLARVWRCTAAGRATMTALADVPPLCDRLDRLNRNRRQHRDLEAAARATLAAHAEGEADALYYLRDELEAERRWVPDDGGQRW